MGFFDLFNKSEDINDGILEYNKTQGAILLDVRTVEEYGDGHIPSSINVPLQEINNVKNVIKDLSAKVFVYCRSGARSAKAVNEMQRMGYTSLKNIGGILDYKGEIVK